MPFDEEQLTTWATQGAVPQSRDTYATVCNALERDDSPYKQKGKKVRIRLQGSYGNDTNVYKESDVDVLIELRESTFYNDLSSLTPPELATFKATYPDASYNFAEFRTDVLSHLQARFGTDTNPGQKAICINASGNRRKADVVVCVEFRRYRKFPNVAGADFESGICFYTTEGTRIVNYPAQHSANATAKHQAANEWFKPLVRIYKNMRNRLVANELLTAAIAPSYYIEGLLYNVPNDKFGTNYVDSFMNTFNWLWAADRSQFLCVNRQYKLLDGPANVTWSSVNCNAYLEALRKMWVDG
jgi:predicted nucleotidyltransferase